MKKLLLFVFAFALSFPFVAQAGDNAKIIWQDVPAEVITGRTFNVSFTIKNTGTTTWHSSTPHAYKLGSQNPSGNTIWGTNRIKLPVTIVAPGQTVTFNAQLKAPSNPGVYNCQWRMIHETNTWFGEYTTNVRIKVRNPYDRAKFISQVVPSYVGAGQSFTARVTYKNTGETTWHSSTPHAYRLGSQNPQDNKTWGTNRVYLTRDVAPGQTYTFVFSAKAPTSFGNKNFQWRMVHEGNIWFGDYSQNKVIFVTKNTPYEADFISQIVPSRVHIGTYFTAKFTFKNIGRNVWYKNQVSLESLTGSTWSPDHTQLPNNVAPGQNVTISMTFRAGTPGAKSFQWQLNHYTQGFFNEKTTAKMIFVYFKIIDPDDPFEPKEPYSGKANSFDSNVSFTAYPNPVVDYVNVEFKEEVFNTEVLIANMHGQTVRKLRVENNREEIELSDLPAGIYIITAISGENKISKKIIVK